MTTRSTSLSSNEAERWTRLGALCALCLLLGYIESFVPIPIPGVKLGLANIPVLVALSSHDLRGACWIAVIKVLATSLLFGNPVTFAYSAVGTVFALALMCPLSLLPTMRLEMVSIVGALAHEAGQLLVAQQLLGTPLVWYSAPLLAIAGCITGMFCGVAAQQTAILLQKAQQEMAANQRNDNGDGWPTGAQPELESITDEQRPRTSQAKTASFPFNSLVKVAVYIAFVVVAMHEGTLTALALCLASALAAAVLARTTPRALLRSLLPTLPIALVTLAAQIASVQQGVAVTSIGSLVITQEALVAAAKMALRLASITIASVALVSAVERRELARMARALLRPLELLGLDPRGPELALSTTVSLLPLLVVDIGERVRPKELLNHSFWTTKLPSLVRELYRQALNDS